MTRTRTIRPATLAAALVALLAACGDGDGPGDGTTGVRVVAGADVEDTIGAVLTQALVVEVRGASGAALRGVPVTFRTLEGIGATATLRNAWVAALGGGGLTWIARDTTDGRGRAAAIVQLGTTVGPATVHIEAPAAGIDTIVSYTVRAGAAHDIQLGPIDTALWVGNALALRAVVRDRGGNPLDDAVTIAAADAGGPVSVSGNSVRAERIGRGVVIAHSGAVSDTARVSVVPRGVLVAWTPGGLGAQPRIVTLNTDGSGLRTLVGASEGSRPRWSPDSREVAYVRDGQLRAADMNGSVRVVHAGTPALADDFSPEYSPDGQWIYATQTGGSTGIWRARSDGSRIELTAAEWPQARAPGPAPTGERLVYQTLAGGRDILYPWLRILDVATGVNSPLDVPGQHPRWSPTGEWIAYLDYGSHMRLTRPDGTGRRALNDKVGAHGAWAWSPDGEWIVVSGLQPTPQLPFRVGLTLVRVSTGEALPLAFAPELWYPDWRR